MAKIIPKNTQGMSFTMAVAVLLTACSMTPCRESKDPRTIKVAKPNGSLQCGMGTNVSVEDMEKDLKGIKVISKKTENDGKMYTQMCGSATGEYNVYEIPAQYVDQAINYGFQKWTDPQKQ